MVHLSEMPDAARERLINQELPEYEDVACVAGPPLNQRRIAIVTSAGLHRRSEKPFTHSVPEYRVIPDDTDMSELIMSHASTNYDRTGYHQDFNICFPIDRLHELDAADEIGSVAAYHYSFMGASPPVSQESAARDLAAVLKEDQVDGIVLTPV